MGELPPPPERLGRFEILDRLAVGGMAEVFLAMERGVRDLERLVVIKRIIPHLAHQERFVEMFVREAKFLASISHPNIIHIHELGQDDGSFFMAMEYVAGVSLVQVLQAASEKAKPIPIAVVCSVATQLCAGLHAAHELKDASGHALGLVHRDVSPHNIMLTAEGHVKLLDFGIAKATELGVDYTKTGTLKGKLRYMSPEQCRQEPLDRRSDLFALGIVLWEMVAGRRLFKRKNDLLTMQAIVNGEIVEPRVYRPELPDRIAGAILHALDLDPSRRPSDAGELKREIEAAAEAHELSISSTVVGPYVSDLLPEVLRQSHARVAAARDRSLTRPLAPDEAATKVAPVLGSPPRKLSNTVSKPQAAAEVGTAGVGFLGSTVLRPSVTPSESRLHGLDGPDPVKVRSRWGSLALLLVALIAVGWFVGAHLARSRLLAPRTSGPLIELGLAPILDPSRLVEDLEPLRLYLERTTGRPIHFQVATSYGDLSRKLLEGTVHFASLPPYTYLETKQLNPRVEVVVLKLLEGSWGSDGVLLVREGTADGVADLKGKTWCFPDARSTTGYILPRLSLLRAGLDPEVDLLQRRTGNHLQSLRDLNEGLCDVAGTYSGVMLNAQAVNIPVARLRTLEITGRAPADAIVAGPNVSAEEIQQLKVALLSFSPKEHLGSDTLGTVERISGFAEASDAQYDGLRTAIKGLDLPASSGD